MICGEGGRADALIIDDVAQEFYLRYAESTFFGLEDHTEISQTFEQYLEIIKDAGRFGWRFGGRTDMLVNSNSPNGVVIAVFGMCSGCSGI